MLDIFTIKQHAIGEVSHDDTALDQYAYSLDSINGIQHFLKIVFKKELPETAFVNNKYVVEIPTLIRREVEKIIIDVLQSRLPKTTLVPLFSRSPRITVKNFGGLIKKSVTVNFNERLKLINLRTKIKDIGTYYAGPGIILEEDFSPLLLCTITYIIYPPINMEDKIITPIAIPHRIKCYIHPKVLQNQQHYFYKGIMQHYCQIWLSEEFHLMPLSINKVGDLPPLKGEVIVSENINSFFHKIEGPEKGLDFKALNFCINEYLNAYVEDMFHATS